MGKGAVPGLVGFGTGDPFKELEVLNTHPALPNTNSCSTPNPVPGNVVHILPRPELNCDNPEAAALMVF